MSEHEKRIAHVYDLLKTAGHSLGLKDLQYAIYCLDGAKLILEVEVNNGRHQKHR